MRVVLVSDVDCEVMNLQILGGHDLLQFQLGAHSRALLEAPRVSHEEGGDNAVSKLEIRGLMGG